MIQIGSLIPLALGYSAALSAKAAERNAPTETTGPAITRDSFSNLWGAGQKRDLRLAFFAEDLLQSRIRKGVYVTGNFAQYQDEYKTVEGLTVEGVLKSNAQKRLNQWNGIRPAIIIVKKDQIKLGSRTREFLELMIEPGDALIFEAID